MNAFARTCVLLLLPVLAACGGGEPVLERVPATGVILAFGDSLTVGVGASSGSSYPEVLQELVEREVVSAGISGETTVEGVDRLPEVLEEVQPNLVILMEGGNDILRNQPARNIKQNLAEMIEMIRNTGAQVVLIGVTEKNIFGDVEPLYDELADEHEVLYLRSVLNDLLRESEYKSDPIHLNDRGYRKLAEGIAAALEETGAL
jgi:lysophospholipase L1-like esterase